MPLEDRAQLAQHVREWKALPLLDDAQTPVQLLDGARNLHGPIGRGLRELLGGNVA